MANDYRILDERDIKNFQAGNKLEVTKIGNKVTYEHIGEPPNTLPSKEKILEYGNSFNITVPSVYDSTGHVKSETKYSFIMPQETDTSNFLTTDNFLSESPISVNKSGKNVTYSHDLSTVNEPTTKLSPNSENIVTFNALSAVDSYGHATEKTTYTFEMPDKVDVSNFFTADEFLAGDLLSVKNLDHNIIYSHEKPSIIDSEEKLSPNDENIVTFTALSATDNYGHATEKTTYTLEIPNTSNYPTKNDFTAGALLTVAKGADENDNTVNYSHNTVTTSKETPLTVDLSYGNPFSFDALSEVHSYGHATKKTTYKFKMPAAPNVDTTGIITKNDFAANAPLEVDKSTTDNTVTYSHTGSSPSKNKTISESLTFGGTFDITVPSAYNTTGHVTATQPYTFTMPKITTKIITIDEDTFTKDQRGNIHQWTTSSLNIDIGSFTGFYVTLYPNYTGADVGSGYDPGEPEESKNKTMVDARLFLPGSITFFAESPDQFNQVSFIIPRLYILTPKTNSYHGFSYIPTGWLKFIINFSTDHSTITSLTLTCEQQYVKPTFINKIIITAY